MYGDEAQVMGEARKFIQGVYTSPFMVDALRLSALYDYLVSFPLRLTGSMDVTVARGFSGVVGALSMPMLYLTAAELGYPRRVGVVAGVALATTFWDVHWSRLALPHIMTAGAGSVAVLCTVMAVRRSNLVMALLAGAALAWTVDSFLSGVPVTLVIGGWLALLLGVYSGWWRQNSDGATPDGGEHAPPRAAPAVPRRKLALRGSARARPALLDLNSPRTRPRIPGVLAVGAVLGVAALIGVWPLVELYISPGSALSGHVAARYILAAVNRAAFASTHPDVGSGLMSILWYQLKATFGMFTVRGDPDPIFNDPNRPLLDPISGFLFLVGVARVLTWQRRPAASLNLLWLVLPLVVGTMLTNGTGPWSDTPDTSRSVAATPAMCLLIALGLETGLAALAGLALAARKAAGPAAWWPSLRLTLVALVALTIGLLGVRRYWDFVATPIHYMRFYTGAREWSVFLGPRRAIAVTVVSPTGYPGEFARLYAPAARICMGRWNNTWTPCPPARIIIFDSAALEAQRYQAATHVPVRGVPSDDGVVRFWYAEGRHLPDPAHVIGGLH
jgi:Dolichyl-phosphate-mannose-protein mannosyltransferase